MANARVRGESSRTARSAGTAKHTTKRLARRGRAAGAGAEEGLRERKKARLRQEIIESALRLFRARGYEDTRVEDIVKALEISQPTFFRYFPTKDAVLCEVGYRGYSCITEKLKLELSSQATTAERLRRLYQEFSCEVEANRWLWRAVVLSGAMDPLRSPQMQDRKQIAASLLQEILEQGQKRGEISDAFPVAHLAEFMDALYNTVVRNWMIDASGPDKLVGRVRTAVEFFLRGVQA